MMKNYRSDELYEEIKERVGMEQVLTQYGITVKKHLCICPFHNDSKPSMRVYDKSFYCFSCGTGGDVIKFVALYLDIRNGEAAKTIAGDFGIQTEEASGSTYAKAIRREKEKRKEQQFLCWIKNATDILCEYHRNLLEAVERHRPLNKDETISWAFIFATKELRYISFLLDELATGDRDKLVSFYNDHSEEVKAIGNWIGASGL